MRHVVQWWVLAFALAKLGMAVGDFILAIMYFNETLGLLGQKKRWTETNSNGLRMVNSVGFGLEVDNLYIYIGSTGCTLSPWAPQET